jgi:uncharacterized delta-60 repeat protein
MKQYKSLFLFITAFTSLIPVILSAQADTAWTRKYNGPVNGLDWASVVQVDRQGNVFIAGESDGSGTHVDGLLIKYNSAGVQQWLKRYNAPTNLDDAFYSLKLDTIGNIYVAGITTRADSTYDFLVIKYNSNGDTLWKRTYNGTGNYDDLVEGLTIDGQGNVYITGESYGAGTGFDIVTIKYNSAGVAQWTIRYNGSANDQDIPGWGISVDGSYNVYVAGATRNVTDNDDVVIIKYNSSGVPVWTRTYNGPYNAYDWGNGMTIDNAGNAYIAAESQGSGTSLDFVTIKYNTSGDLQWASRYNGPTNDEDIPVAISVNNQGEVYIAGWTSITAINYDMLTIKYNANGDTIWTYNGPGNQEDKIWCMSLDNPGNVYVAGTSAGSSTGMDYTIVKYSSSGIQRWVTRYTSTGNNFDQIAFITLDNSANIYVTGGCWIPTADFDITTIKYTQIQNIEETIKNTNLMSANYSIYPNPANKYFTLRIPNSLPVNNRLHIKIYDVTGKFVKEVKSLRVNELRVPLDGIKNGIYFIQIDDDMLKEKLVITK